MGLMVIMRDKVLCDAGKYSGHVAHSHCDRDHEKHGHCEEKFTFTVEMIITMVVGLTVPMTGTVKRR